MRLSLHPHGQFGHGAVHSYTVELPTGDKALLTLAPGKGWHLEIVRKGMTLPRGLFGTTHDILMLLEAEYFPQPQSAAGHMTDFVDGSRGAV